MPTYYKRDGTGTTNWNANTSWSTVSSTSSTNTGTFPSSTTADPVIFDVNSSNVTLNVAGTCTSINFSGYTNTITMTNGLSVNGNVTLSSGMTISSTGGLTITANSTYTSNGKIWPNTLTVNGGVTLTLGDNITVQNLTFPGTNSNITINSNSIDILGNLSVTMFNTIQVLGTTNLSLKGTGTWLGGAGAFLGLNLDINTTGTITINGNVAFGQSLARTLTHTSGTMSYSNAIINFNGNVNLDSNSITTWPTLNLLAGANLTLLDNSTCTNFTTQGQAANNTVNGFNLYITGNLTGNNFNSFFISGTTTFNLIGTGTYFVGSVSGLRNNLVINTTGSITLNSAATIYYGGATSILTHTAGTIIPGTSTLVTTAGVTYNINSIGFNLYNWSPAAGTHTINVGTITLNNNLTLAGNTTFLGSGGWTSAIWTDTTAGRQIIVNSGSTYGVTSSLNLTATNASPIVFSSTSTSTSSIFTLNPNATQSVQFVRARRIDSGNGQTIWDTVGTIATPLTDTVNWNIGVKPAPFNSLKMGG